MTRAPTLNAKPIYLKLPRMAGSALPLAVLAGVVAVAVPVSDADMRAATDRLLVEVSAARRIPPRGTLERRVETWAAARERREAEVAAAAADPELAARVRLWERLGLVPGGSSPERLLGATLDAAATASYDPLGRRLSVPDWIPLADQRPALAHALAHALADQRFGIRDLLRIDLEGRHHLDGDAERARLALVEGDAALTALEVDDPRGALAAGHALPSFTAAMGAAPGARDVPAWLRANAGFTHAGGLAFVARVRARQPWSAVDALWAEPPQSSEQVLHPEKYDARERPLAVPALPVRELQGDQKINWRESVTDVLGELGARTWLATAAPALIAERAAAGWGGDRATLFVPASEDAPDAGPAPPPFVVWSTVWDDVTDAEDFARAAAPVLAALAGEASADVDDPHRFVARNPTGVFALAWRGAQVALLVGAPEPALTALDGLVGKPPGKRLAAPRPAPAKRVRDLGR
jgi:hypothetical protein